MELNYSTCWKTEKWPYWASKSSDPTRTTTELDVHFWRGKQPMGQVKGAIMTTEGQDNNREMGSSAYP